MNPPFNLIAPDCQTKLQPGPPPQTVAYHQAKLTGLQNPHNSKYHTTFKLTEYQDPQSTAIFLFQITIILHKKKNTHPSENATTTPSSQTENGTPSPQATSKPYASNPTTQTTTQPSPPD